MSSGGDSSKKLPEQKVQATQANANEEHDSKILLCERFVFDCFDQVAYNILHDNQNLDENMGYLEQVIDRNLDSLDSNLLLMTFGAYFDGHTTASSSSIEALFDDNDDETSFQDFVAYYGRLGPRVAAMPPKIKRRRPTRLYKTKKTSW